MEEKIEKLISEFCSDSFEWGYSSIWISDILNEVILDRKILLKIINELHAGLEKRGILLETYLEIIIHDTNNCKFNSNKLVNIDNYLYNNYKIEIVLNNNSEIFRAFMKILKSEKEIQPLKIDNITGKTYLLKKGDYLHIYI